MSWYQLIDICKEAADIQRQQRERIPNACPIDGEPLREGPSGVLFCTFDGWQYPRDYLRP